MGNRLNGWMLPLAGALGAIAIATAAAADVKPATAADYAALAKLPDWSGTWQPDWSTLYGPRTGPTPSFTPAAAQTLAAFKAKQAKGENLQTEAANCVPNGMPQIMRMPYPIEFIFSPGRVTIAIETYSQVRRIYTDGRALPEDPDPTYNGSSVGRWEGDTLIVDTIGLNPATSILPGIHPTEQTRIRETFRLEKPDMMLATTTITDPTLFAQPFELKQAYVRHRDWDIREYVCQENNRDAADEFGRPSMNIEQ
ncbi:MAG: hypothetical protein JWM38_1866 [Sphingomonas bacterium]|nr:hypothetical protein [Sphingomonas bacterium]MDB5718439.1 hypothetical protein [Sphingomonas bacterium]